MAGGGAALHRPFEEVSDPGRVAKLSSNAPSFAARTALAVGLCALAVLALAATTGQLGLSKSSTGSCTKNGFGILASYKTGLFDGQ